jgi:hypothetical protein
MAVPEATVYKNYLATGREHQIRFAGQGGDMKPVAVSEGVGHLANREFGLRVS